jgi:hypothetical protein
MHRAIAVLVAVLVLPLAGLALVVGTAAPVAASHTCELRVWVNGQPTGPKFAVDPAKYPDLCGAHAAPTATATTAPAPTPTHTHTPAPSPSVTLGYHAAASHDGLNVHEHGDAPPAWVLDSAWPPFSQSRESHTGYKGAYAVSPGGAESYVITHILATPGARSHGDHDYQLWLRNPGSGEILYYAGVLDFGNPPPLRTVDTGERPIILGERSATDGCETWYSRPGALVMDLGWTICGRYTDFAGNILGGLGAVRTVDWIIPCDRLPAASTLRQGCRTEFGVSRLSFLINTRSYQAPGLAPIN